MIQKSYYTSPEVDVVELQPEGVVCTSTDSVTIADWSNGGSLDF